MKHKENRLQQIITSFAKGDQRDNNLVLSLLEELSQQSVSDFKIQEEKVGLGSGNILVLNEISEPYQLPKLNGIHFTQSLNQSMAEKGIDILWQLDILLAMIRDYLEQNYSDNHLWPEVFASRQKAVDFYLAALEDLRTEFHENDSRYQSIRDLSGRAAELARICREIYPGVMLGTEACLIGEEEEVSYVVVPRKYEEFEEFEEAAFEEAFGKKEEE